MKKAVAIGEAKTNLSKLVERAESGEEVVIRRGAKPVVKIVRYSSPDQSDLFGSLAGKIHIGEDFDEPVPGFETYQ
ncbi:MAG: type II toxin-antitoxin system prevent-host-death family antitoxin [Solirubrobacterales bacterium]